MKRERIRFRVALTAERPPGRGDDNVRPLTDRTRERRAPAAPRGGFEDFLAAVPRLFVDPAARRATRAREIANARARSTSGDDAA
jgi:hypothetical protein